MSDRDRWRGVLECLFTDPSLGSLTGGGKAPRASGGRAPGSGKPGDAEADKAPAAAKAPEAPVAAPVSFATPPVVDGPFAPPVVFSRPAAIAELKTFNVRGSTRAVSASFCGYRSDRSQLDSNFIETPAGVTPPALPVGRSRPNFDVGVGRTGNLGSKLELHSFSFKFEISSCTSYAKRSKIEKIESRTLQNRGLGPPKSRAELSKMLFLKDI